MIRPYRHSDKTALIEIMHTLVPEYFAASEIPDYESYLEHETENYFVYEDDGKIVAGAGINILEKESRLSWDLVHAAYRGKGIGAALAEHRIAFLKAKSKDPIIVRTSQMAYGFYQKHGFELLEIRKDFWAKGFDLYLMKYKQ